MAAPGRKQRRLLIAALLLACMPIRLSVLARGEVAPQDPVLLRAPLSGVIDRIQVQPNQRVKAGDALFDLDATSLAGQFAMAARERDAAQESFRASAQLAVTDDKGKLAMAQDRAKLEEKHRRRIHRPGTATVARHRAQCRRGGVLRPQRLAGQGGDGGERVMTLADPAHVELAA